MTTGRREAKKRAGEYCLITVIPLILLLLMEAALRIEHWRAWRWEKQIRRKEGDEK